MTRNEAEQILTTYLHNKNLLKHCLACEVTMKALCQQLHPDATEPMIGEWGVTGLLHDADYELAQEQNQVEKHGLLLFEKENNIPDNIVYAIKAHNFEYTHVLPESDMDWAIACCDQLTGLIVACALIHPEKKLKPITIEFVTKRFGEKAFAKGVNRNAIRLCEEKLNIPLPEFIGITLEAMQSISSELGL